MSKTYEFDLLVGISTDSYDILGKITKIYTSHIDQALLSKKLFHIKKQYTGAYMQSYPPFSSKRFKGKPLFHWARRGMLTDDMLPQHIVHIHNIHFMSIYTISSRALLHYIRDSVYMVKGKFRQKEIIIDFQKTLTGNTQSFFVYRYRVECSHGTYIRTLAHHMGKASGYGGLALRIIRTQIQPYTVSPANHTHQQDICN